MKTKQFHGNSLELVSKAINDFLTEKNVTLGHFTHSVLCSGNEAMHYVLISYVEPALTLG